MPVMATTPAPPTSAGRERVDDVPTPRGSALDPLAQTMLAQQFQPLPKFNGDSGSDEDEVVTEWLEHLEMVGLACGWSDQVKLVNLVTRLRGSAYSFYRSCLPEQRSSYTFDCSSHQAFHPSAPSICEKQPVPREETAG